jgi:predicted Zn-dependent peptidase
MRYLISSAVALIVSAAATAQQLPVEVFTLDNGMEFLLVPRNDQPNTVSAGWVAKVGSANERPGITGISHFFEHMMFKGTNTVATRDPKRDEEFRTGQKALRDRMNQLIWGDQYARYFRGEIDDPWNPANDTPELKRLRAELKASMDAQQGRANTEAINALQAKLGSMDPAKDADAMKATQAEIAKLEAEQKTKGSIVKDEFDQLYTAGGGSRMNAFTSYDQTFYFINVPSNKMELWCWMESDRLDDSVFREFFSERDVVHEERRLRTESTPTGTFDEQFEAMFWLSSPYSWPVIGWPSDLNSYTMDEAQRYFQTYYCPNNLTGVIVGDFDAAKVKPMLKRYFSRLKRGATPPPVVTLEVKQLAEMRMNAEAETEPQVEVRYHTVPFQHADSYPLEVMSQILNGRTGRLYKSMVEGSGVASDAGARQDSRKYAGAFSFSAEVKGGATPRQLEDGWYAALKRLQDEPVSEQELQKVRNGIAADEYRRLQNNFFIMLQLGVSASLGDWREVNTESGKLLAVTPADIQRVAKKYFDVTNRSVATYVRKAAPAGGTADEPTDPALAALPPQMQAMAKQAIKRIAAETDLAKLKEGLGQFDAQAAAAPEAMRPFIGFMKDRMLARIAELEKGAAPAAK